VLDTEERFDILFGTRKLCCMIDLRRLRTLRELADRGTIAATADALHLTPSAVSQQLAVLEREVGQPLLEPNGRTVRLTSAATAVLAHADTLFSEVERMDATLAALAGGAVGTVRVGAFSTAIRGLVVPAVATLRESSPGLELVIRDVEAPEVFDAIARGDLDVGISMEHSGAPGSDDDRFARFELVRDVLDLALPADHRLAAHDASLSDLAEEPWIAPPVGWSCEDVIRVSCSAAGFTPKVAHRSHDWTAIMAMVGAGLGVAVVPRLAQDAPPPGVVIRRLRGEPAARHLFVICRRGAEGHPAIGATVDAVLDAAGAQRAISA
jgi:DNA-binding transcriptional LysR family regulator